LGLIVIIIDFSLFTPIHSIGALITTPCIGIPFPSLKTGLYNGCYFYNLLIQGYIKKLPDPVPSSVSSALIIVISANTNLTIRAPF
jgi:hypothetical protein